MPRWTLGFALMLLTACEALVGGSATRVADQWVYEQDYERAAKAYESALLELEGAGDEARARRGEVLLKLGRLQQVYLGDLDAALNSYRASYAIGGTGPFAIEARWRAIRLLRDRKDDPKAAARELALLVELEGVELEAPALLLEAAQLEFQAARYDAAIEHARLVLARGKGLPLRTAAYRIMATSYLVTDRLREALNTYEVLALEPLEASALGDVRLEIGRAYEKLGELEKAKEQYVLARTHSTSGAWVEEHIREIDEGLSAQEGFSSGTSIRN